MKLISDSTGRLVTGSFITFIPSEQLAVRLAQEQMSSQDISSDFHFSESGSRLLSESLLGSSSSSRTGHGGDDLSLSELSVHDRPSQPPRRKFSLFAQPPSLDQADDSALADEEVDNEELGEAGLDETMRPEDIEKAQRAAAKSREEKLQSDLYILKKLNAAFDVYKDALRETKSSTDVSLRS